MNWLLKLLGGVSREAFDDQSKELEAISEALKVTTETLIIMNTEVSTLKESQASPIDVQKIIEKALAKERAEIKLLFATLESGLKTLESGSKEEDEAQNTAISRLGLVLTGDADGDGVMDEFGQGGVRQRVDMVWRRVDELAEAGLDAPTVDMSEITAKLAAVYDEVFPMGPGFGSKIDNTQATMMKMINDVVLPEITAVKNSVAMASTGVQNRFQKITDRLDYIDNGSYVEAGMNPDYTIQQLNALFSLYEGMGFPANKDNLNIVSEQEIKSFIEDKSEEDREFVEEEVERGLEPIEQWMREIEESLGIKIEDEDIVKYNRWFNPVWGSHAEFARKRAQADMNPYEHYSGVTGRPSTASVHKSRVRKWEEGPNFTPRSDDVEFMDFYPITYNGIGEGTGGPDDQISFKKLERPFPYASNSISPILSHGQGASIVPSHDNIQLLEHKLYLLWKLIKENIED